jgi:hypothetical protein
MFPVGIMELLVILVISVILFAPLLVGIGILLYFLIRKKPLRDEPYRDATVIEPDKASDIDSFGS